MKKGYVRIPTVGPMPTWEKVMMWLLSILMAVACIGTSIAVTQANVWNWYSYALVGLLGVTSLFIAVWGFSDSNHAKTVLWATVSLNFYGLCVWFGGLPGRTSMKILFALGCALVAILLWSCKPKESRILGILESTTGAYAVISLACWVVWLVPFVITRQHWWKYVGYGVGGLVGLAVLVAIGYALVMTHPSRAKHRFVGRGFDVRAPYVAFVRFPRAIYTVLVGYPRYWYMPEQQEHYAERKPLEMADSMEDVEQDASKPWYIYLPYGGLFRRCRIVWGRGRSCWKVERSRLGLGGYHLVDRQGARLRIEDVNSCLKAGDGPKDILRKRGIAVTSVEFTSPTGISYGQRQFLIEVLDKRTVQNVLESQLSHLKYEECQKRELQNRIEWSNKGSEEQKAKEAESRLEIAKQLAGIAALIKAAPRNKKLGAARHQLTQIVVGLSDSEEKAKALLLDALEALEQSESQSN